jgi:hypothetical protein
VKLRFVAQNVNGNPTVVNIGNAIAAKFGILSKQLHAAQLATNNINIQLVYHT